MRGSALVGKTPPRFSTRGRLYLGECDRQFPPTTRVATGWRSCASPSMLTASSVRPVMTTRAEHLRELARKCALKAAEAKDLAMKASLMQEQKQLLMLAEQAEKEEQNRVELPPRGLTKK